VIADRDVERVLVVVAHPDDAEFWVGGTIAGWTDIGIEVTYCVLTDGGGGGFDPDVPRGEIPRIRRTEQQQAASMLRVREVQFLESAEGSLLDDPASFMKAWSASSGRSARSGSSRGARNGTGSASAAATLITWRPAPPR
jgi:LmbE family N-acetylglucosaminyl deacetylase